MKNKKWFTLVELLLALLIAWTLIGIVMSIYTGIMWADVRMSDKRLLTKEASDLMDTIHTAALDYTVDYEEYFNYKRQSNTWFSSYGNDWVRYYCWSWFTNVNEDNPNRKYDIIQRDDDIWGCETWERQKYLEYSFQHWKLRTWDLNHRCNSWSNMYQWPIAIDPNTWLDYLYLINSDWTERYYFRRILTGANNDLYKVQVLRLKWYDAGLKHDFSDDSTWRFDWFIDTWACDFQQWFVCNSDTVVTWNSILPNDYNDWRVDLTSDKVTVSDFRIDIYPNKDPYMDTSADNIQDPYMKITITMNLYNKPSIEEITLSTTLSFKNSYFNFPTEIRENVPNDDDDNIEC